MFSETGVLGTSVGREGVHEPMLDANGDYEVFGVLQHSTNTELRTVSCVFKFA
jgi:hypothetical protein